MRCGLGPAGVVILAGVSAALHMAKLPPAIAALQAGLGRSLLRTGFLLSTVQLAGMSVGVAFGTLAVRLAPSEPTLSSTVGWVQQWSALGQFARPALVAWVASRSGGWHWTWAVTGAGALLGLLLAARIGALLRAGSGAAMSDNRRSEL